MKTKKPAYYQTPLRSRKAITEWLAKVANPHNGHDYLGNGAWLFCFSVKDRRSTLSFDHLIKVARDEQMLWERAIENARRTFTGREGRHYSKPDNDGFNQLYDGTPVDVEFGFFGRSGDWLALTHFESEELSGYDVTECLNALDFPTLRKLYAYLVMLTADLGRVLAQFPQFFRAGGFVGVCESRELPTASGVEKEAQERAHWEARDTVTVGG